VAKEQTITKTNFKFPGQKSLHVGKVRDVYNIDDKYIVMVVTDRISAFDVVLPQGIPFKGEILNQLAASALEQTKDIVQNWVINIPDPNVTLGYKCEPFKVEMVIRGYLTGHAWREYRDGKREICGEVMPDGMREHDKFPHPIVTQTTKASEGHDEDISPAEIVKRGLMSKEDYEKLAEYTKLLFARGTELARNRGLILVDTKYEFGKRDGEIYLIDEVHTPDSSRFFYSDGYEDRQAKGEPQRQLSKEFVREWLISHGFQGKEDEKLPELDEGFIAEVTERYIELYKQMMGEEFIKPAVLGDYEKRIESDVVKALEDLRGELV
jgi:phosphoribosylaminoimidazole-succinocarboxamide synthase